MEKTETKISAKKKKKYETPKAESESIDKLTKLNFASCGAEEDLK